MFNTDSTIPTAKLLYLSNKKLDFARQAELEREFFSAIRLKNGTFKFTYPNRLEDLNDLVNQFLSPGQPLKVMDVAVSSGITTAEWIASLKRAGIEPEVIAGDSVVNAFLISVGKHMHVLVDSTGYQLQLDVWGNAISTPIAKRSLISYFFPVMLLKTAVLLLFPYFQKICSGKSASKSARRFGVTCHSIQLVSPSLKHFENLAVIEDDILMNTGFKQCFDVIRAANILNRSYFSDSILSRMLLNLRSRLVLNGLLVLCRTNENGTNRATIFSLGQSGEFEVVARLNGGIDIESLVLQLPAQN